jgi:transketolase
LVDFVPRRSRSLTPDNFEVDLAVAHVPTFKPLDRAAIARAAGGGRLVVTLEEHTSIGGLAGAVASSLLFGTVSTIRRVGLHDEFLGAGACPPCTTNTGCPPTRS